MPVLRTTDNFQRVVIEPTEGARFTVISPNWCDKTTWYYGSAPVVDEVLSGNAPLYTQYSSASPCWVDVSHGKISGERKLRAQYSASVAINGVYKTENSPDETDGDYSINYYTGKVTFNNALQSGDVVSASFYAASSSSWTVKPDAGKKLRITEVEVQLGADVEINDTVLFQAYGSVNHFAPQLTPTPYASGTLIPVGDPTVYQTMYDYINESNKSYPIIKKIGGITGSWRSMNDDLHIFRWDYKATTDLYSSKGMEIRISLEGDSEFGGNFAVATFYGLSLDEV